MLKKFALFVCCVALAATGCKSKEQVEAEQAAIKAEQDQLQGKWKLASRSGDDVDEEVEPNAFYVIDGDIMRFVVLDKDGKEDVVLRQKLTIIPNKEPKSVDLIYVDEAGKPITTTSNVRSFGKTKRKTTTLKDAGIYKIDGDKLTFCISYDEKKRPTDFTAPPKSARFVLTLEKMK
jgi:uncharacterized protein (TIGR03067 family)